MSIAPDANDREGKPGNETMATASSLNKLTNTCEASIHTAADVDWYKMTLEGDGRSANYFLIDYEAALGALSLEVYDETGGRVGTATGNRLDFDGFDAGTYYVRVAGVNGATNSYSFTWDRTNYYPARDANDAVGKPGNETMATASSLNKLTNTCEASIHTAADVDWYRFEVTYGTTKNHFTITYDPSLGDLSVALYDANGAALSREAVYSRGQAQVDLAGLRGTYYVKIAGVSGATNSYSFTWDRTTYAPTKGTDKFEANNTLETAKKFSSPIFWCKNMSFITQGDVDYYTFTLSTRGTASNHFTLTNISMSGRIFVSLLDKNGVEVRTAIRTGLDSRKLDLTGLAAGKYYIRIESEYSGSGGYDMNVDTWSYVQSLADRRNPWRWGADRYEGADSPASAATALARSGTLRDLSIHTATDVDWYAITLHAAGGANAYVSVSYAAAWGALSLAVYDAGGNRLLFSDSGAGKERLSLAGLAAGSYYVSVQGDYGAQNTYSFSWNRGGAQKEENGTLSGTGSLSACSLTTASPSAIWEFCLAAAGKADNFIRLASMDELCLTLRDAQGRIIFTSNERTLLSLGGLAAGNYSLSVSALMAQSVACAYSIDYNLAASYATDARRGADQASLFALNNREYAYLMGYGNVTLADFSAGTHTGERFTATNALFYDAEKSTGDTRDDNQCWAATASNMLAWSGWGTRGIADATGATAEDVIFNAYNAAFPDQGGMVDDALRWFFGSSYKGYSNSPGAASGTGNYLGINGAPRITKNGMSSLASMDELAEALHANMGVGLTIRGSVSHAVTVWGYTFNANVARGEAGYYTGLFITDSDSNKQVANETKAADVMQLISVNWNASKSAYVTSYAGSNTLVEFYTLDNIEDWPAYASAQEAAGGTAGPAADLDGLLADAMTPTPALFGAGAEAPDAVREEKRPEGVLVG